MFFAQMLFLGYGWFWTASLCFALFEGGALFKNHPSYILYGLVVMLFFVTFRNWAAAEFDLARRPRGLAALRATLKKPHTLKWPLSKINLALACCFTLAVVYFAIRAIAGESYNAESILIALFMGASAVYAVLRTLKICAADSVSEAARI